MSRPKLGALRRDKEPVAEEKPVEVSRYAQEPTEEEFAELPPLFNIHAATVESLDQYARKNFGVELDAADLDGKRAEVHRLIIQETRFPR